MPPRKAIIIDIPIRKFMNERPGNRVIEQSGNREIEIQRQEADRVGGNPVIGRSGDRVIETQRQEADREQNRVIEQSGNRVIETQKQNAVVKSAESENPVVRRPEENPVLGWSADGALEKLNQEALARGAVCTWRRGNGKMCGRPADGGRDECWLHAEWYSRLPAIFGMPYPEDAVAIHQILARTMSMVIGGEISPQKAQAVTKLCRELRRNLMWYQREMGMW